MDVSANERSFSTITSDILNLLQKSEYFSGIFVKNFGKIFEQTYGYQLPPNWADELEARIRSEKASALNKKSSGVNAQTGAHTLHDKIEIFGAAELKIIAAKVDKFKVSEAVDLIKPPETTKVEKGPPTATRAAIEAMQQRRRAKSLGNVNVVRFGETTEKFMTPQPSEPSPSVRLDFEDDGDVDFSFSGLVLDPRALDSIFFVHDLPPIVYKDPDLATFDVFVVSALSPSRIVFRLFDQIEDPRFATLYEDLDAFYGGDNDTDYLRVESVTPLMLCACELAHDDGHTWHRVDIVAGSSEQAICDDDTLVRVYLVDYGETHEVPMKSLRRLHKSFVTAPRQALFGKLYYEHATARALLAEDGGGLAAAALAQLAVGRALVARYALTLTMAVAAKFGVEEQPIPLSLYDTGRGDACINDETLAIVEAARASRRRPSVSPDSDYDSSVPSPPLADATGQSVTTTL